MTGSRVEKARALIRARPLLMTLLSNLSTALAILYFYSKTRGGMAAVLKKLVFQGVMRVLKAVPAGGRLVAQQNAKIVKDLKRQVIGDLSGEKRVLELPEKGWSKQEIFETMERYQSHERRHWVGGKVSGCVYHGDDALTSLMADAQAKFMLANPLHPDVFPMVRKMEAEVVNFCVQLFQGGADACGTITSGGTESILMACRASKEFARQTRNIVEPEMVVPVTAHAAFNKAAEYFGITLRPVPVDVVTKRATPAAVLAAVTANTVLIVVSAPNFPNGTVDHVEEIAAIAHKKNICMHVDCCLGSLLMPFARMSGYPLPAFDFSVPGVTSISCDTHKYGFSPKGSSVVMYSNQPLRRCQYFVAPDWTGGIYASPTIAGSRPGAVSAATWAAMVHLGREGYARAAAKILKAAELVEEGLKNIDDVRIVGTRHLSVISFATAQGINVYSVGDAMKAKGWNLNALQNPPSLHLCVTYCNCEQAPEFVRDLEECVEDVRSAPAGKYKDGSAAIYGLAQSLPDKSMVDELSRSFVDTLFEAKEA